MNLKQAYDECMNMLGYTNEDGIADNGDVKQKLLSLGNMVFAECNKGEFKRIKSTQEEIGLSDEVLYECFLYGLCMWISLQNNDSDNNAIFTQMFEQKKAKLNKVDCINDEFMR